MTRLLAQLKKLLAGQRRKVVAIQGFPGDPGKDGYVLGYHDGLKYAVDAIEEELDEG